MLAHSAVPLAPPHAAVVVRPLFCASHPLLMPGGLPQAAACPQPCALQQFAAWGTCTTQLLPWPACGVPWFPDAVRQGWEHQRWRCAAQWDHGKAELWLGASRGSGKPAEAAGARACMQTVHCRLQPPGATQLWLALWSLP